MGARYYDTTAGRFVTRDPIGYKGGINLYGFTGNNPVNEQDPSGLDPNDPTDPDFGRDIDIHPGMHRGTKRSNTARAMTHSLVDTLKWAILGVATDGLSLLGRGGEAVEGLPRPTPRIETGNANEGWIHIAGRHITGTLPGHAGGTTDTFPAGTTRAELEAAAKTVVGKGQRVSSDSSRVLQTFVKRMRIHGKTMRVGVTVHKDGRVITMHPATDF